MSRSCKWCGTNETYIKLLFEYCEGKGHVSRSVRKRGYWNGLQRMQPAVSEWVVMKGVLWERWWTLRPLKDREVFDWLSDCRLHVVRREIPLRGLTLCRGCPIYCIFHFYCFVYCWCGDRVKNPFRQIKKLRSVNHFETRFNFTLRASCYVRSHNFAMKFTKWTEILFISGVNSFCDLLCDL